MTNPKVRHFAIWKKLTENVSKPLPKSSARLLLLFLILCLVVLGQHTVPDEFRNHLSGNFSEAATLRAFKTDYFHVTLTHHTDGVYHQILFRNLIAFAARNFILPEPSFTYDLEAPGSTFTIFNFFHFVSSL